MRRNFILIAAALILAACSPETFTMNIEMRHPSRSGLDLGRKTFSVVYADNGNTRDTLFLRNVAAGFSETLEEDYFGGQQLITLFSTPADTNLSSKERLQNLIMETGSDVVFVFDTPEFGDVMAGENSAALPFKLRLYAYDSMDKSDNVLSFNGSTAVKTPLTPEQSFTKEKMTEAVWKAMPELAAEVGRKSTGNFVSTWQTEQYSLYYYENLTDDWDTPSQAAYEFRWADAIKLWTGLLKTNNPERRACAAYDIATACYMLGNYPLALQWLDQADKECELFLSPGLRRRILSKMK